MNCEILKRIKWENIMGVQEEIYGDARRNCTQNCGPITGPIAFYK